MYGLPPNFNASIFVGKTLQQVAFSANTINLSFNGDLSITIESSFAHKAAGEVQSRIEVVPVKQSCLMQLTEKNVVNAETRTPGTLILYFEDGQSLTCFDDSTQYESYRVTHGEQQTIV